MNDTSRALLLLACLALLPPTAGLAADPAALDDAGRLHTVRAGYYGTLFADGAAANPATPVLALEIAGGERLLVPGSEAAAEDAARLVLAEGGRVTVLWQSLELPSRRALYLAQWDGDGWSETYEVHAADLALATEPQVVTTRDRQTFTVGNTTASVARTVIHLVWQETSFGGLGFGDLQVHYSPLVLAEGTYVGHHDVVSLSELYSAATFGTPATGAVATDELAAELAVAADDAGLTVGFADLPSGRLVSLRLRPLPLEIGLVGEAVRQAALELGPGLGTGSAGFRDKMRAQIIGIGARHKLHATVVDYLAQAATDWLGEHGAEPLAVVADGLRDHTVSVGAALGSDDAAAASEVLVIDVAALLGSAMAAERVEVAIAAERPLPATGPGSTTLFARGDALAVAWHDAGSGELRYVESTAAGWSAEQALALGPGLGVKRGLELISARLP